MRGRFGVLSWIFSLAGALLGSQLVAAMYDNVNGPMEHALWGGAVFLAIYIGGFAGLSLSLCFGRWRARRPRGWLISFILCGALIFAAGAGGQALFMVTREEVVVSTDKVDMVLLLDASSSMDSAGYDAPRTEAASQFVDAVGEDNRLQAVSFASTVLDSTDLLYMDSTGKQELKDFIASIDSIGQTDFNAPLRLAVDTLTAEARPDVNRAILLLTDGEGDLDSDVAQDIQAGGIMFFSVRISKSSTTGSQARALIDLSNATGGFDTRLKPAADGSVDTAALLESFNNAFEASTENRVSMEEDLLISSEETSLYQFAVRLVTLLLCALLFGVGYFTQFRAKKLLLNLGSGVLLAVLITLLGGQVDTCLTLACLLLGTAYVSFELNEGEVLDV